MTRRPGLTTTEVLVALFIMALGVIAILTMFPLGMLNMGQALRDDRTAQCAITADGYMRTYWKANVVENQTDGNLTGGGNAFEFPGSPALTQPGPNEPSYPVFVDPIGVSGQIAPNFVGPTTQPTSIPRRTLQLLATAGGPPLYPDATKMSIRACSMTDGLTYGMNGSADVSNGVQRDMRYNWLWVLQRPVNKNPTTVTMQVVVFERRSPRYYASGVSEQVFPNALYSGGITMTPGATSLTLPLTSGVQKGNWILDATNSGTVRQAIFYRVSSATDNGGGSLDIELESPIRRIDGNSNAYSGTIVVIAGVADVFTRPNLTP